MRFIFFTLIISQFFYFNAVAEKRKGNSDKNNHIGWELINEEQSKSNQIIWKSYKDDESYFENLDKNKKLNNKKTLDDIFYEAFYKNDKKIIQFETFLPLNNFLNYDDYQTVVQWKSSFGGGKAGGTGQQNNSIRFDYGLSEDILMSLYFAEADDDTYNHIKGSRAQYFWQNYALSLKKKLLSEEESRIDLSLVSTLEFWRQSSGSDNSKSIYNEYDNFLGKDRFENLIGSLSLPISKKIKKNITFAIVPGVTFLPEKLGQKTSNKNFYGNNYYLGTGIGLNIFENLNILASYTNPFGPGDNYFDKDLNFSNKSIYSFGIHWDINPMIGLEGKITNSFGSTPSLGILTIPSDDLPLYSINFSYKPNAMDTILAPLKKRDFLTSFGGLTVSNALLPEYGSSQFNLNYDSKGNLFGYYAYSLSNVFQLEVINIGSFQEVSYTSNKNHHIRNTYLGRDNFNFRLGGKLLLFSPQKNDFLWTSIRSTVGRNQDSNQGYLYSELINTLKVNDIISLNLTPKYFMSGVDSFAAIGASSYINLSNNIQLIPEINKLFSKNSEFNSTIALRYSYGQKRSIDFYYSNALGLQDLGQILKGDESRFGIRLNYIY